MISEEIKKIDDKLHSQKFIDEVTYSNIDWIHEMVEICHENGYGENDTLQIIREVGYLLMGNSTLEEVKEEILERTNLSKTSLNMLIDQIAKKVFLPIGQSYAILKDICSTEIRRIENMELEKIKRESETSHILIVPIKPKEGQSTEEKEVVIPDSAIYIDPYKEIPE